MVKVYPGVGHFIHTDVPYEFARDTVDFMRTGRIDSISPEVVDALINGVQPEAGGEGGVVSKPAGLAK